MKKYLIAIDDGHGKETAGKRTPAFSNGTIMRENEFNEAVALYLKAELERHGFQTLLVAPESTDTSLKTRVQRANDACADAYISIHANAYGATWNDANGIETWIYEKVMGGSETYRLAESIHKALIEATGRKNRGMKRSSDLFVLNSTRMHAALIECGFMTNKEEAALLIDDGYRAKCAEAICRGICKFYNVTYMERSTDMDRFHTIEDMPSWARPLIAEMQEKGCIGDEKHMNMSEDMLRVMVLMDRLWKKRK